MKFRAAIFDMDGLLIDSEPLWRKAEIKVFATVGVRLTESMCMQTMGMRIDEVVQHWHNFKPWAGKTLKEVEKEVLAEVKNLIRLKGAPMPGTGKVIAMLRAQGFKLAVASSSYLDLIQSVLGKLGLQDTFDVVHSAEFELYGKPHPGIYLSTARFLGVDPQRCIAFEDSYNGILSAKKAGMFTIAVPEPGHYDEHKFAIADLKLRSLEEFSEEMLDQ